MDEKFSRPKSFGQILDHTFSLSKSHFKEFFLIMLIFLGPIYLLQALMELMAGVSFFRGTGMEGSWAEQVLFNLEETESVNVGADLALAVAGLLAIFIAPVSTAAIMLAINHLRKGEPYTIGSVIRQAFSRYWPMLGSTLLFMLIASGLFGIPIILIVIGGAIGAFIHPAIGVAIGVLLFIGLLVGCGYLLTRWSFYFGSVVFKEESPGLSRSWRLTKGRFWPLFGLYIVFFLIISAISATVELSLVMLLGQSVLLSLIVNAVTIFTTMILTVGYTIMYFDLKIRHDADDLKEMIEEYHTT